VRRAGSGLFGGWVPVGAERVPGAAGGRGGVPVCDPGRGGVC
jgi:hypothetical protein